MALPFDANHIGLAGRHLIEASAGTGKTYSIANLFLRLLLEPHPSSPDGQPLEIDRILVVTFTNAATDELRGRIRRKLEQALSAFRGLPAEDDYIRRYCSEKLVDNRLRDQACERLYRALLRVDEAAIHTIHGFAARAVRSFLFETGALPDVEVVIGQDAHREQIMDDLWRELQLAALNRPAVADVLAEFDLSSFRRYVQAGRQGTVYPALCAVAGELWVDALERHIRDQVAAVTANVLEQRQRLQQRWQAFRDQDVLMRSVLETPRSDVNYKKFTLKKFVEEIDRWVNETGLCGKQLPRRDNGGWGSRVRDVSLGTAGSGTPFHTFFLDLKAHLECCEKWNPQQDAFRGALLSEAQQRLSRLDERLLQPEDVITLLNRTLDDPERGIALRRVVAQHYPVCMVDEFQDTDPEQFRLFDRLYAGQDNLGFFAIGDPKQSIYGFRGADVFAYLDVKSQTAADNIHVLDVSFRSTAPLVHAINALFAEQAARPPVFVYDGIAYEPVASCEVAHGFSKPRLVSASEDTGSLVFVGHPGDEDETTSFTRMLPLYAQDAALRIARLLADGQLSDGANVSTALKGGDIAVLVRDYTEAAAMRQALRHQGIASVYLSQRDSVFRQCEFAQDLLPVLRAMDEPSSKRTLMAAFATPLLRHFSQDCSQLDRLAGDDHCLELCVEEFAEYRRLWEEKGLLSALDSLLVRRDLVTTFAAHPDCNRLMTDFRHLSELLQQEYCLCGSRERLIDWYAQQLEDDSSLDEDMRSLRLETDANLVQVVTLHGCKGLEYPVVFMPFFFQAKSPDLSRQPPRCHLAACDGRWETRIDFTVDPEERVARMMREQLAEDMRLFYVGVTRAIYRCYLGIGATSYYGKPVFERTVWAHLLGMTETAPEWNQLTAALKSRLDGCDVSYELLDSHGEIPASVAHLHAVEMIDTLPVMQLPQSAWMMTSYSALVHGRTVRPVDTGKDDEPPEAAPRVMNDVIDTQWAGDIRFALHGSANTGDCLHEILEQHARGKASLASLVSAQLPGYGIPLPEAPSDSMAAVADWLDAVLQVPLADDVPCLQFLFDRGVVLPEFAFDFAIGTSSRSVSLEAVNTALAQAGAGSIALPRHRSALQGMMTGSIDALALHDNRIYIIDYKSNTLGLSPQDYDQQHMQQCMKEHRYDLQYLIYSVAAHRYMRQRLQHNYSFDRGDSAKAKYSFGGIFYLFLRGMGIPGFARHGIWFHRPGREQIEALDAALRGMEVTHAQ